MLRPKESGLVGSLLLRHIIAEAVRRREAGEALVEIGRSYNVSHSTISRL